MGIQKSRLSVPDYFSSLGLWVWFIDLLLAIYISIHGIWEVSIGSQEQWQ